MKFYRESYKTEETCNLGCKHHVYYYEVVEPTEVASRRREVFYGDSSAGMGVDRWYADENGMIYYREATWDGPGWPVDENEDIWMPRPVGEVKKDLEGNLL